MSRRTSWGTVAADGGLGAEVIVRFLPRRGYEGAAPAAPGPHVPLTAGVSGVSAAAGPMCERRTVQWEGGAGTSIRDSR
ncbi:hypothetical protein GCM10023347_19000 [Streptomyces chumphonensis]